MSWSTAREGERHLMRSRHDQVEPAKVVASAHNAMQRDASAAFTKACAKDQFSSGDRLTLTSLQCTRHPRSNDQPPVPHGLCSSSRVTVARGQFSIELVPFIILGAILLLLFVIIIAGRLTGVQNRGEQEQLQRIVEQVHTEVSIAASVNNGYARNFTLPTKIGSATYSVGILKNHTVQATTESFEASIVTFNVSGQPVPGNNQLRKNNDIITLN